MLSGCRPERRLPLQNLPEATCARCHEPYFREKPDGSLAASSPVGEHGRPKATAQ